MSVQLWSILGAFDLFQQEENAVRFIITKKKSEKQRLYDNKLNRLKATQRRFVPGSKANPTSSISHWHLRLSICPQGLSCAVRVEWLFLRNCVVSIHVKNISYKKGPTG